jgi:AcrR family transcriptional regulator
MRAEENGMTRRGRPAKVSREALADAAVELGFTEFTLAEVAARLSVSLQTVYNHVRDRDELLLLAAEGLEERHVLPPEGDMDWLDWSRAAAHSLKALYEKTPGLASILMTRQLLKAPPRSRPWEISQRVAERSGFDPVVGLWANMAVHEFIYSWCARGDQLVKQGAAGPKIEMLVDTPLFSNVAKVAKSLPYDARFAVSLEALLAGLSSLRGRSMDAALGESSLPKSPRHSARQRKRASTKS